MRTSSRFAVLAAATFSVTTFGQTTLSSAEPNPAAENMTPSTRSTPSSTPLNSYAEAGRPNMNHFSFGVDVIGKWNATTTMWSAPGATPETNTATSTFLATPGMGGRFVSQTFESEAGEQDFFGNAWIGFNNVTERYEMAWIDSTSTNILFSYGTRDENGAVNFTGSFADPISGQKKTTKSRFTWPEKGQMVFEMWSTASDGTEFKSLEVKYTKVPWSGNTRSATTPTNAPSPNAMPAATTPANANPKVKATTAPATSPNQPK
ncbi:MAG: hypothetical protein HBSAPP03_26590 [Phycisphaerae bacterium]|nr:MAG: hypothetical protein HBSAPP03_26590 [Phycisphaerae bacterium]